MSSGFLDVSLSPKTKISYLWRPQDTSKNQEIYQTLFWTNMICGNSKKSETDVCGSVGKDRHRQIKKIRVFF